MTDKELRSQLEGLFSDLKPEAEVEKAEVPLEEAITCLLGDEAEAEPGEAGLMAAEVPPPVPARPEEAPEESKEEHGLPQIPPASRSGGYGKPPYWEVTRGEQHTRIPNILLRGATILGGVLLVFLLIRLIWPIRNNPVIWSEFHTLYFAACAVALTITLIQWMFNSSLTRTLQEAEERHAEAVRSQTLLEEQMDELATANALLQKHTLQLQTAALISQVAASMLDPDELVQQAVNLIRERFDLYYVGLFLIDESGQWATLRAGTGAAGRRMLAQDYRVEVGDTSTVGRCTANAQAHTAPDLGTMRLGGPIEHLAGCSRESLVEVNPLLPEARSEMALPLRSRGRVIGALDVQSTERKAFSQEDIAVLQAVADQTAVAIDNAQLFAEIQARLEEMETRQRRHAHEQWADFASARAVPSYERTQPGVIPLGDATMSEEVGGLGRTIEQAIAQRETVVQSDTDNETEQAALVVPISLHGEPIGALGLHETKGGRRWTDDEIALIEAVADQMALALENARLFEETQRALRETEALYRANRAIGASTSPEAVGQALMDYAAGSGVDAARVLLFEHDEQGRPAYMVMREGWTVDSRPAQPYGTRLSLDDYPLVNLMNPNEPIILEDVLTDPRANETTRTLITTFSGLRSFILVPITVGERWIGMVFVGRNEPSTFADELVRGYWTLAGQAAVALENLRLLEETQRRATQLAAAAEVARDATAILDVDQLLDETAHLISEQFGFYHAGVFLLDKEGEYAVLQAASSEGGYRMLERGHKLRVGKVGIVGYVAGTGKPRIALDVGKDAIHFVNPDLPDTRSEMGLPLKVREHVIGVLDVQSIQEAAFSEDDVAVLQTLADQLAAAIANARLFQEVRTDAMRRNLINEVQQAAAASLDPDELLHQAGEVISRRLQRPSALLVWEPEEENLRPVAVHDAHGDDVPLADGLRVTREVNPALFSKMVESRRISTLDTSAPHPSQPAATAAMESPSASLAKQLGIQTNVYVPLTARDQVLGVLALAQPEERPLEDLDFAEIVGANLSVALENARLYQDAVETTKQLEEIDRLKTQFLANMSHELRTPLNSIIGFSRVILKGIDGPLTDMQRTDLQAVYDSGQHLLGLINDILDISKIQAGKMELSFEEMNLREVIKGVMSTSIVLIKDKPIELQQSIPPDLPTMRADTRRIRQVLFNLIGNSAKFTEQGFIRVEAQASPTEVVISVSDSGTGIPPNKLRTIFEEFTQADGSSTRRAGGTGLGLSITRNFVELHGGRIWAESTPGVGSTFHVALPIGGPPKPSEEVEEAYGKEEAHGNKKQLEPESESDQRVVLCVDDDEGVITLFRRYLSKQGYRVVGLTESTAVTEQARQLKPFAVTLDVLMPDKDGWLVIQELKADPDTRNIPVIVCSIVGEKERGLSLGASDYLLKPILEEDLVAALERLDREEGRHRVLVVDDQPRDRKLLCRMIESQDGYEVVEAASGQEAIALIRQVRPNIIILDLMMPEVDGFAVLESIKADRTTRSIPIIVVTAKDLTREERNTLNKRVETLLQKGLFEQQELLADVAAALERIKTDRK